MSDSPTHPHSSDRPKRAGTHAAPSASGDTKATGAFSPWFAALAALAGLAFLAWTLGEAFDAGSGPVAAGSATVWRVFGIAAGSAAVVCGVVGMVAEARRSRGGQK